MKRKILLPMLFALCGLGFVANKPQVVMAEEIQNGEQVVEQEKELTQDELKEEIKEWLSQFMDQSMVAKIISWAVDAGVLTALFAVVVKYRKYKATSIEDLLKTFKDKTSDYVSENFKKLGDVEISKITSAISKLEQSTETIMKVLVLMQDSTTKGKVALLDFLGSKTESAEVKQTAELVNAELVKEQEQEKETKEKVSSDYQDIF